MTSSKILDDAFEDCFSRLMAGETISNCLQRYPDLADELRPLLETAQAARLASEVPASARDYGRQRLMAAVAQRRRSAARPPVNVLGLFFRFGLAAIVGLLFSLIGLGYASASTLPGDGLYPVKLGLETASLYLASDPGARLTLEEAFMNRRRSEVETLLNTNRRVDVKFGGVMSALSNAQWRIDGFTVGVTHSTEIVGDPRIGFYVEVAAEIRDGALTATKLTMKEKEVRGDLSGSGDRWAINGVQFAILPGSIVNGTIQPGAQAVAQVRTLYTEDVILVLLTVLGPANPTQATTNMPSATPAFIAELSQSSEPTETLPPSATNRPTDTSPISATGRPTDTPPISATRRPTEPPQPSATSQPTETPPPPSATSQPTEAPQPSATSQPTETPQPSATSQPTETPPPGDGCALTTSGIVISGQEIEMEITNNAGQILTIASLSVTWPDAPESQLLKEAKFGGVLIASSYDNQPASNLPPEGSWVGVPTDRELGPSSTKLFELLFEENLLPSGYAVTVTFDNGCSISQSN